MELVLFGDQTTDPYPLLKKIVLRKGHPVLTAFLEQAASAIRHEISTLPRSRRQAIPNFLTISNLLEHYHSKGVKVPELESGLTTLSHLAHYIGYYEERPSELPSAQDLHAIGLCTGMLAAAAIVSARSLSELIPLAVEALKIAIRTGYCVGQTRYAIEDVGMTSNSWTTVVAGLTEEDAVKALTDFHAKHQTPLLSQAYISAVSSSAISISGPPSTTALFFDDSELLRENQKVPVGIHAPYHAAHLYDESDIARILTVSSKELLTQFKPQAQIQSASSGELIEAESTYELYQKVLRDMLFHQVRLDALLDGAVSQVTLHDKLERKVATFGSTRFGNTLVTAIKNADQTHEVSVVPTSLWIEIEDSVKGKVQHDKIAIVGMAGRFPEAANHEALWDLLMNGLDVHKEIPSDRFDAAAHTDPSGKGKNKTHTPYGCFINEPGLFDPRFFNMSPREAAQTDPMGRLAIVTAYEALEMSGYVPNRTPSTKLDRIGTFYGQTSDDWREINAAENVDTYFITGGVRAFAPGRINYYFKFSGPSFSVDTACSSSLAAIQLACTSLWAGDCDTAVCGGLNVLTNPDIFSGLSKGQFLSKTGSCKTYDNDADGYCRGDGAASVILKRYDDAIADQDNILGCILGAATNHSANAVSITHPHAGAQEFLYSKVLAEAGVDAHEISYVEMHGTGTQAGDGIEMTSVTNVFAPRNRRRNEDEPLYLGAIKANIGHGEAASGTNSLVKVLMMLRENLIPPNVGIKGVMNKTFPKDMAERKINIPQVATPFPRRGAEKRKLFLNNFSAAGGNTAILLEDGPAKMEGLREDPRASQVITVTARAISSLKKNIQNTIDYLQGNPTTNIASLAYTTTARRIHHSYRVSCVVRDVSEAATSLAGLIKDSYTPVGSSPPSIVFTFTGQGSQYTNMGHELYAYLDTFREDIDSLNRLALSQGFPSFKSIYEGVDVATLSPVAVQLGLACTQVALARMWASWGVKPSAVVGHSLGEYAALHVAGVISASDMVYLVGHRASLLVKHCVEYSHGMLAVKGSESAISRLISQSSVEIACKNGPEEIVLSGTIENVTKAKDLLTSAGLKATLLKVPFAFHSAQVDSILEPFKNKSSGIHFGKPKISVISALTGQIITEAGVIGPDYLARHAREPVNFSAAITAAARSETFSEKTIWHELGAHTVCSGMVKASLGASTITTGSLRRGEDNWKTITNTISTLFQAGLNIEFDDYHRGFSDCHELLVLPSYAFDNKKYWLDYHNNWTLTKGEALQPSTVTTVPTEEETSKFSTTSCQKIVFEEINVSKGLGKVIFQSDLAEPKLANVVRGHLVNENPLIPSTLYADQALTVAEYLYKQLRPDAGDVGLNVCKMEVGKTLIAKVPPPPEGQHVQIEGVTDLANNQVLVKFSSVTRNGKKVADHAHCVVKYENKEDWQETWDSTSYMVRTQIDILKQKLQTGNAHKILRGMAYMLFRNFVDYAPKFRGMDEVVINSADTEATAKIKFQTNDDDGDFNCAPYWIDSLCHISGFICNGTDLVDSVNNLSISHAWSSMRFAKKFSASKTYQSYVRMLPKPNKIRSGDVYIFEGDELVGVVGGLKFQEIPRKSMNIMLPPPNKPKVTSQKPSVAAKPAQKPATKMDSTEKLHPSLEVAAKSIQKASKAVKTAMRPSSTSMTAKVMQIVAAETDVDMSELVDAAAFANLGVDSLLSLTISARLREELELEIPSNLFVDHDTVGSLKKYFAQFDGASAPSHDSDTDSTFDHHTPEINEAYISTPPSSAPSVSEADEKTADLMPAPGKISLARQVIAEEMDVDVSEIVDGMDLSEMGMDSLMSLTILSALRERTGTDIHANFLVDNPSIDKIEIELGMRPRAPVRSAKPLQPTVAISQPVSSELPAPVTTPAPAPNKPATSLLLQGNPKTATQTLFLLPDGSGSATSYTQIPSITRSASTSSPTTTPHPEESVAVYALNCPYLKQPHLFTMPVESISQSYIAEIRRRQPHGPYNLGGWSAGGVLAYEVCVQLLAAGEKVSNLLLLDAPCPVDLEPLPSRLHVFFDEIGLLGEKGAGSAPSWLLDHFSAAIKALSKYEPVSLQAHGFDRSLWPNVYAVWATDGVLGAKSNETRRPKREEGWSRDPKPMTWLLEDRTEFGGNGWEALFGGEEEGMRFGVMGGNHFSMMKEPHATRLRDLIREGLRI